jgi:hypothetical protein
MRSKLLAVSFLALLTAGSAFSAVILEKRGRQLPFVEIVDCQGVHSFILRGPTGTSRRPVLVPPREYWVFREAGQYHLVLRYHDGTVCCRLVTPEVFARYNVGDDFNDCAPAMDNSRVEDSKTMQPVVHHRTRTAQLKNKKHSSHQLAKHRRHHSARLVAQR